MAANASQAVSAVESLKVQGNTAFHKSQYADAIKQYTKAIEAYLAVYPPSQDIQAEVRKALGSGQLPTSTLLEPAASGSTSGSAHSNDGHTANVKDSASVAPASSSSGGRKRERDADTTMAGAVRPQGTPPSGDGGMPVLSALYSNRCAAQLKVRNYEQVVTDACAAILHGVDKGTGVKVYYRLGLGFLFLARFEEAAKAFVSGLNLHPKHTLLQAGRQQALRASEAVKLRVAGNDFFFEKKYQSAIEQYSEAIRILRELRTQGRTGKVETATKEEKDNLVDPSPFATPLPLLAQLFGNRSAAFLRAGRSLEAVEDACTAVDEFPEFVKGFYRLGAALESLQQYGLAAKAYRRGVDCQPDHAQSSQLQDALKAVTKKEKAAKAGGSAAQGKSLASAFSSGSNAKEDMHKRAKGLDKTLNNLFMSQSSSTSSTTSNTTPSEQPFSSTSAETAAASLPVFPSLDKPIGSGGLSSLAPAAAGDGDVKPPELVFGGLDEQVGLEVPLPTEPFHFEPAEQHHTAVVTPDFAAAQIAANSDGLSGVVFSDLGAGTAVDVGGDGDVGTSSSTSSPAVQPMKRVVRKAKRSMPPKPKCQATFVCPQGHVHKCEHVMPCPQHSPDMNGGQNGAGVENKDIDSASGAASAATKKKKKKSKAKKKAVPQEAQVKFLLPSCTGDADNDDENGAFFVGKASLSLANNVGSKGRGFVATSRIPAGTLLMREPAVAFALDEEYAQHAHTCRAHAHTNGASGADLVVEVMNAMVVDSSLQERLFSLYPSASQCARLKPPREVEDKRILSLQDTLKLSDAQLSRLCHIVTMNMKTIGNMHTVIGVGLPMPDKTGVGLFPLSSILNHSCWPNAVRCSKGDIMEVRAIRDIEKGEEVCDSYLGACGARAERRADLMKHYQIACSCQRCTATENSFLSFVDRVVEGILCPLRECKCLMEIQPGRGDDQKAVYRCTGIPDDFAKVFGSGPVTQRSVALPEMQAAARQGVCTMTRRKLTVDSRLHRLENSFERGLSQLQNNHIDDAERIFDSLIESGKMLSKYHSFMSRVYIARGEVAGIKGQEQTFLKYCELAYETSRAVHPESYPVLLSLRLRAVIACALAGRDVQEHLNGAAELHNRCFGGGMDAFVEKYPIVKQTQLATLPALSQLCAPDLWSYGQAGGGGPAGAPNGHAHVHHHHHHHEDDEDDYEDGKEKKDVYVDPDDDENSYAGTEQSHVFNHHHHSHGHGGHSHTGYGHAHSHGPAAAAHTHSHTHAYPPHAGH